MRPKRTIVPSDKNFSGIERVIGLQQNPVQDICSLNFTPHQGSFLFTCFCPSCHSKSQPHFVSTWSIFKSELQLCWASSAEKREVFCFMVVLIQILFLVSVQSREMQNLSLGISVRAGRFPKHPPKPIGRSEFSFGGLCLPLLTAEESQHNSSL